MKRIIALVLGLVVLAGCGAVVIDAPEDVTRASEYTTIPSSTMKYPDPKSLRRAASLPEDNIYLYSDNDNMLLFQEGHATAFYGWGYEKYDYPELAYIDVDGDGEREIVAVTLAGAGTGLLLTNLHILKVTREPVSHNEPIYYKEFTFTHEEITAYIETNLKYKRGEKANTVDLTIDGKTFSADLDSEQIWLGEIKSGDHVYFRCKDGSVQMRTILAACYEDGPPYGDAFDHLIADVIFDGKQISLKNFELVPAEWPFWLEE